MNSRWAVRFLWVMVAAGLLSGCSTPVPAKRLAQRTAFKPEAEAGVGVKDQKRIEDNCGALGKPEKEKDWKHGRTQYIYRDGYVLEHSAVDKIPLWVCEHVTRAEVSGPLRRPDPEPFAPDPDLPEDGRAELSDYRGSGFDRGHMAPSGNQTVDTRIQDETYFLSNMAPQTPNLNQRIWKALEETIREWAEDEGEVWTVTGPMFHDPDEENPAKADGSIPYTAIGSNEVGVPTHCYKIVLAKNEQGQWRAAGFVMKNQKKQFPKPYRFNDYIESIDWIEEQTGLDFMPGLNPSDEKRLERAKAGAGDWGL